MRNILLGCMILLIVLSCEERKIYTPKPKGYFRIALPEHEYKKLEAECSYLFEIPVYVDLLENKDKGSEPCWYNISYKNLNATIHTTYKSVNNNINKYLEDSRTLAYKHSVKADAIDEKNFVDEKNRVYGTLYEISGNAASSLQFHLTDSINHFYRGSLYFNNVPNKDSLAPVIDFIKADVIHLIETFRWTK